jgi:hypothetical protein
VYQHHSIALDVAKARVADLQGVATNGTSSASRRRGGLRRIRVPALALAAVAVIAPAGALAQPQHDAASSAHRAAAVTNNREREYGKTIYALTTTRLAAALGPDWREAIAPTTSTSCAPTARAIGRSH